MLLGEIAKLGPFSNNDLCALVNSTLDKLITHLLLVFSLLLLLVCFSLPCLTLYSLLSILLAFMPKVVLLLMTLLLLACSLLCLLLRICNSLTCLFLNHKEIHLSRVNNPTLNQNIGKYNLNHIWDRVLFKTPGLKLGSSQYPAVIQ